MQKYSGFCKSRLDYEVHCSVHNSNIFNLHLFDLEHFLRYKLRMYEIRMIILC